MLLRPGGGQGPRWGGDAAPPRRSGRAGSKTPAGYSSGDFYEAVLGKILGDRIAQLGCEIT